MKKLFKEFKEFINKGNALSLAIGVILGASFTAIVSAINTQVISPLIGLLLGDNDLSGSLVTVLKSTTDPETGEVIITNAIYWGAFIQSVIDFLLTAVILFAIFKIMASFTNVLKKANDMEIRVNYKLARGKKLSAKEQIIADNIVKAKEENRLAMERSQKEAEPTIQEKQLELLQSINENLINLKNN